jgi:O-antigen/teichoic acid export membrane protein
MSKRRLVTNTIANISAQGIASLVSLITLPLLLDAFGRPAYGVFVLAGSTVGFVSLFDFGVGLTTIKSVAGHLEREESQELRRTVGAAAMLYTIIGVAAAAGLMVIGYFSGSLFALQGAEADLLRYVLWVYAVAQLVIWPALTGRHVLAGHQRYTDIVKVSVAVTLANAAAIVAVLATGQGPLVLAAIQATVTVIGSLALAAAALRVVPPPRLVGRIDARALKEILAIGLPIFTIQISAFVMRQQTDRLILGVFLGVAVVALYEAAAKLGTLVAQVNELTTSAMLPYMTGRHASGDEKGLGTAFLFGTRYTGMLLIPVLVGLAALAPELIRRWVGPQREGGIAETVLAARLLILSQVGPVLYSVADPILIGKGRFHIWTPYAVGLAALNLGLSVLLVRPLGFVGVALATLVASATEAPLYLRFVFSEIEVPFGRWVAKTLLPSLVVAAVAYVLAVALVSRITPASLWPLAAVFALTVGASYSVGFLLLSSEEKRTMRELFSR